MRIPDFIVPVSPQRPRYLFCDRFLFVEILGDDAHREQEPDRLVDQPASIGPLLPIGTTHSEMEPDGLTVIVSDPATGA